MQRLMKCGTLALVKEVGILDFLETVVEYNVCIVYYLSLLI